MDTPLPAFDFLSDLNVRAAAELRLLSADLSKAGDHAGATAALHKAAALLGVDTTPNVVPASWVEDLLAAIASEDDSTIEATYQRINGLVHRTPAG
jgi:hypothetical protein